MRHFNTKPLFVLTALLTMFILSFVAQPSTSATDSIIIEQGDLASLSAQAQANWVEQAYLKASNPGEQDGFGGSVAISGDTLVVGAEYEDGDGTSPDDDSLGGAGAAYVFVRQNGAWTQQAYLKASNADAYDGFGVSVAISGDTLVVGAWA
jgi:hypothetical protein